MCCAARGRGPSALTFRPAKPSYDLIFMSPPATHRTTPPTGRSSQCVCSSKFSMSLARYKNTASSKSQSHRTRRKHHYLSEGEECAKPGVQKDVGPPTVPLASRFPWGLEIRIWDEESRHGRDSLNARIFQKCLFALFLRQINTSYRVLSINTALGSCTFISNEPVD